MRPEFEDVLPETVRNGLSWEADLSGPPPAVALPFLVCPSAANGRTRRRMIPPDLTVRDALRLTNAPLPAEREAQVQLCYVVACLLNHPVAMGSQKNGRGPWIYKRALMPRIRNRVGCVDGNGRTRPWLRHWRRCTVC